MKIKTITCHDVYNYGASLQAYALAKYLMSIGHEVEIINYKPNYLSNTYAIWAKPSEKYDKILLRQLYQIIKLPGRLTAQFSRRKKAFVKFKKKYLPLTKKVYKTYEELNKEPPEADVYFAGSDQIWNPLFENGRDPSFYLMFSPKKTIKASYAASFATDSIDPAYYSQIQKWLNNLDFISVRESTGVSIIDQMKIHAEIVVDPVFLLPREEWTALENEMGLNDNYILVYDFDRSQQIKKYVIQYANTHSLKIYSIFPCGYSNREFRDIGPCKFLYLIHHAKMVVSNSFHGTAFAIIYGIPFTVFDRNENINTRMQDLLKILNLNQKNESIDYSEVYSKLESYIYDSKKYIQKVVKKGK